MKIEETPCPYCDVVGTLGIKMRLVAKQLGEFSLSGNQMKFSCQELPVLYCDWAGCGFELVGVIDDGYAVFKPPRTE